VTSPTDELGCRDRDVGIQRDDVVLVLSDAMPAM
jgi:hypothetical protein